MFDASADRYDNLTRGWTFGYSPALRQLLRDHVRWAVLNGFGTSVLRSVRSTATCGADPIVRSAREARAGYLTNRELLRLVVLNPRGPDRHGDWCPAVALGLEPEWPSLRAPDPASGPAPEPSGSGPQTVPYLPRDPK